MEEQKKSRKPLLVGVIAAVVVLAALLALLLTQCVGGQGPDSTSGTGETVATDSYTLYWNVNRNDFKPIDGVSTTGRKPADDGFYHMVFAVDGKQVELRVKERRLVNIIDAYDLVGLVFDENGDVIDVTRLDDMPLQKLTWQYYIQSFGGNAIKLNSSEDMDGMEELIKTNDQTVIYDVSGWSEFVGAPAKLQKEDRAYVIANLAGEITHIFLYERVGIETSFRAECKHCGEEVTWKNWLKKDSLPITSGHYFLENPVEATGQNMIQSDAQICLDLNGQTVHSTSTARIYSTFNEGSSLAVMDNSDGEPGKFVSEGQGMDQGCCLWARFGNIDIYDITVDGSGASTRTGGAAVGVESKSKVTLHSGTLIGGKTVEVKDKNSSQNGGAVRVYNGYFVMEGGLITGGSANGHGGCVFVYGKDAVFTMNGGKITNGRVNGMNGGNVAVMSDAEFIMNGGTISGGRGIKSKDKNSNGAGGNVYIYRGTFTMNGGTITDGRCYNNDGTRDEKDLRQNFFNVDGKLYMNGGKITGYVQAVDTNLTDKYPSVISVTGSARISGAKEGGNNLYLNSGVVFKAGRLSGKADVRVYATGIFSEKTRESNVNYVHSDVPNADVVYYDGCLAIGRVQCMCGASLTEGKAHSVACDQQMLLFGAYTGSVSKAVSGNYYLTGDLLDAGQLNFGTADTKDENGKTVRADAITFNLDLNGHKIISKNRSILVFPNVTLNISDSVGGGYIEGKGVTLPYSNAGVLLTQAGSSVNVIGATLKGSATPIETMKTGGVIQQSGTVNLYDATIIGTKLPALNEDGTQDKSYGSAVFLTAGSVLNMYGNTTISGGETTGYQAHGGNVYAASNAKINMYDNSKIYGGKASPENRGGGGNVYLLTNATLSLYDNASVTDGVSDPKAQPYSMDVFAVGGKIHVRGGHVGTVTMTSYNGTNCEVLVGTNAKIDKLQRAVANSTDKPTEMAIVQIEGVLADDAKIVMNSGYGVFTGETVAENADNFVYVDGETPIIYVEKLKKLCIGEYSDPPVILYHCICGMQSAESLTGAVTSKGACFGDCDGKIVEWTPWTGTSMPSKAGYWVLGGGAYSQGNFAAGVDADVYIDLFGASVSVKADNRAFMFQGNGTSGATKQSLTIMDSVGGGSIKVALTSSHSALIMNNQKAKGTFNLYGGHLDASQSVYTGKGTNAGAINLQDNATINLFGGKITGSNTNVGTTNKTTGGAINLSAGSVLTMSGNAEIVGGAVATAGNAVYVNQNASLIMRGNASITSGAQENSAISNVEVAAGGRVKVADSAKIDDIKLSTDCYINVEGTLTDDAKITVDVASGVFTGKTVEANTNNFVAKNGMTVWFVPEAQRLCIGTYVPVPEPEEPAVTLYHCICGMQSAESLTGAVTSKGSCFGDCEGNIVEWTPWTGTTMPDKAGYWVMNGGNYTQGTFPEADADVYIDLNGRTINTGNNRAFSFKDTNADVVYKQSLTITDSVGNGSIVVALTNSHSALMMNNQNAECTFNLYGGHLDASQSTYTGGGSNYGAIYLKDNATINLYGGKISGGSSNANGTQKSYGGVISLATGSAMTMSGDAEIVGGTVSTAGGAIYAAANTTLAIKDGATVTGGTAADGATIYSLATVEIENATINGGIMNRNGVVGGGLGGALFVKNGNLSIKNSVINGGYADELSNGIGADSVAYGGGAIWADSATVMVENSRLVGYTAAHSNIRRGGVVYTLGNTSFTLKNSTISGAKVQENAAAVMVSGTSTFTMTGADSEITANADANPALNYGGAITVSGGATLNIEDGTVTGTKVQNTYGGGAVTVYGTGAKLIMSGGKITGGESVGNEDTVWGGGVDVADNATVELSGSAKITGNIGGNLFLHTGSTVKVGNMNVDDPATAEVDEGANVGISMEAPGVFSSNEVTATTGFSADVDGTEVRVNAENKLELHDPNYVPPVNPDPDPEPDPEPGEPETGERVQCMCGASKIEGKEHANGCDEEEYTWVPYDLNTDVDFVQPTESKNYYLNANITDANQLQFNSGNTANRIVIRIDMNGYSISAKNRALQPFGNTELWLSNSKPTKGGVIEAAGANNSHGAVMHVMGTGNDIYMLDGVTLQKTGDRAIIHSGIINLQAGNNFTMYGGTINATLTTNNGYGGAITATGSATSPSTFTMEGGVINGAATAIPGNGGNVYVDGATFIMNGGTIQNGKASNGGNVYVNSGLFQMNGGEVTLGCAAKGGNVFINNNARMEMTGESFVTDGYRAEAGSTGGANIYIEKQDAVPELPNLSMSGEAEISGGDYTGGTGGNGGNIFMDANSYIKLEGTAHITGGTTRANGGNINNAGGVIEMTGDSYITGGTCNAAWGGKNNGASADIMLISGGQLSMNGGQVGYVQMHSTTGAVEVSGSAKIKGVQNDSSVKLSIVDVMTKDAFVCVTNATAGTEVAQFADGLTDDVKAFAATRISGSDSSRGVVVNDAVTLNATITHCVCGAGVTDVQTLSADHAYGCNGAVHPWTAYTNSLAAGRYYLTQNISGGSFSISGEVYIDLNGYNITTTGHARTFSVSGSTAKLWLCNTRYDLENTGIISSQGASGSHSGVIMLTNDAKLNMFDNVTLQLADNQNNVNYGGAVSALTSACEFNMYGGKIIGGDVSHTTNGGGAVFNLGTFNMYGGEIIGGHAAYAGGAVMSGGTFKIDGSEAVNAGLPRPVISGGSAGTLGGNIYISAGRFTLTEGIIQNGTAGTEATTGQTRGGNLFSNGTAIMNSGSITGGKVLGTSTNSHGGNVYVNNGSFEMKGGSITLGESQSGQGGNVCSYKTLTISGAAEITGGKGNSALSSDVFSIAGGVTMNGGHIGNLQINGATLNVQGDARVDLAYFNNTNSKIDFSGKLTENASIVVRDNPSDRNIYAGDVGDGMTDAEWKAKIGNVMALKGYYSDRIFQLESNGIYVSKTDADGDGVKITCPFGCTNNTHEGCPEAPLPEGA